MIWGGFKVGITSWKISIIWLYFGQKLVCCQRYFGPSKVGRIMPKHWVFAPKISTKPATFANNYKFYGITLSMFFSLFVLLWTVLDFRRETRIIKQNFDDFTSSLTNIGSNVVVSSVRMWLWGKLVSGRFVMVRKLVISPGVSARRWQHLGRHRGIDVASQH